MSDSYVQVAPDGIGKKIQTFENTVSAVSVHAQAVVLVDSSGNPLSIPTSAELVSVDAHAAAASAAAISADVHANTVSARAVSISSELASMVQIASAAATSADGHANTVSARAVSISNELGSLVNIVSNAVSNELSARGSASAALETHINAVSARAVSISNELGSLIQIASAAAISADAHANTVSARAVSISNELGSLLASLGPLKAVNTAAQASITVSGGSTVSGVSVALISGQTYSFDFMIPFVTGSPQGICFQILAPAVNNFMVKYTFPTNAGAAGIAPGLINYNTCSSGNPATKYSTVSITLTGVTMMVQAQGIINASANGSLKFLIGPNTSGGVGVVVQLGANLKVYRHA